MESVKCGFMNSILYRQANQTKWTNPNASATAARAVAAAVAPLPAAAAAPIPLPASASANTRKAGARSVANPDDACATCALPQTRSYSRRPNERRKKPIYGSK